MRFLKLSFGTVNLFADEPPNWNDMEGKPWKKVPLDSSSPEYLDVLKLFKASKPQFTSVTKVSTKKREIFSNFGSCSCIRYRQTKRSHLISKR